MFPVPVSPAITAPPGGACGDEPVLRADAERNRAKLLTAARTVFAEQGLEAPLEEIARQAGVGIATLYRRFPTRDQLIAATFIERMTRYADAARAALAAPDPWAGLTEFTTHWTALQIADRGLGDVMSMSFPENPEFERARAGAYGAFTTLIQRAKDANVMRADFVPEDLIMMMMANAGIMHAGGDIAPQLSERLIAYLLQSFRAEAATGPLPAPPSPEDVHAAMCR